MKTSISTFVRSPLDGRRVRSHVFLWHAHLMSNGIYGRLGAALVPHTDLQTAEPNGARGSQAEPSEAAKAKKAPSAPRWSALMSFADLVAHLGTMVAHHVHAAQPETRITLHSTADATPRGAFRLLQIDRCVSSRRKPDIGIAESDQTLRRSNENSD